MRWKKIPKRKQRYEYMFNLAETGWDKSITRSRFPQNVMSPKGYLQFWKFNTNLCGLPHLWFAPSTTFLLMVRKRHDVMTLSLKRKTNTLNHEWTETHTLTTSSFIPFFYFFPNSQYFASVFFMIFFLFCHVKEKHCSMLYHILLSGYNLHP